MPEPKAADKPPVTATPPVTPPAATPPAAPSGEDPWMAQVLADMGKVVTEGVVKDSTAVVPEIKAFSEGQTFTTMGEHARYKAERAELEKKPDEPAADDKKEEGEAKTESKPDDAKAEEKPEGEKKPEDGKSADATVTEVQVEKAKPIEEIVEGIVNRLGKAPVQPSAPVEPKTEQTTAPDADAAYIESLDEGQRDAIELARYAATRMPEKYGTLPQKTIAYYKQVDTYIETARKADKEWDPEQDESFQELIAKSKPAYQSGDQRKLERSLIADEVRRDVEAQVKPKLEQAERVVRNVELKPEVDKAAVSYRQAVAERVIGDDKSPFHEVLNKAAAKGWSEDGWKEASELDPLAASTAKKYIDTATEFGKEVLALTAGVTQQVPYNPSLPANHHSNVQAQRQAQLFSFIDQQEQIFNNQGGNMKVQNGRAFVTRAEYHKMPADKQQQHWTLQATDVLDMLSHWATDSAKQAFTAESELLKRQGYVRVAKAETPKKADEKPPETKAADKAAGSPKAKVTTSPGAGTTPANAAPQSGMSKEELDHLLSGGPAVMRG